MGGMEEGIVKQAFRNKMPIPEKILNAPELREDLAFYFNAFLDLDCDRDFGLSMSPIKWSSIKMYCEYHNLDEEQSDLLFYHVRKLDNVRLKEDQKKQNS